MAKDEQLRIGIDTTSVQKAVRDMSRFADGTAKSVEKIKKLVEGSKELQALYKEVRQITGITKAYTQVLKQINAVNKGLLQTERERAKVSGVLAQAEKTKASATLMSEKANTQSVKTEREKQRLEMDAIKLLGMKEAQEKRATQAMLKNGAYNKLTRELSAYTTKLRDAIATGKINDTALAAMANKHRKLQSAVANTNTKFDQLTGTMRTMPSLFSRLGMAGKVAFGNLIAQAVSLAAMEMRQFTVDSSRVAMTMDGVINAFAAGAGGFDGAGRELQFVRKAADEMGIAIASAYGPYSKFMTSFSRSGGTIAESRQIFEDISAAAVSLHLSAEQTQSIYIALEQMANKGTVQMEELKRQLGNSLPGAFELASEAMGVSTSELTKMMKAGELMSSDFLPKFAAKIREVLGGSLPLATKQAQAEFNRLSTDTFDTQVALGKLVNVLALKFIPALRGGLQGATRFFTAVETAIPTIEGLAAATAVLSLALGAKLAVNAIKASGAMAILTTKMSLSTIATNAATAASARLQAVWLALVANPIGAALTVVVGGLAAVAYSAQKGRAELEKVNQVMQENITKVTAFAGSANLLSREYIDLASNSNRNLHQQQRLSEVTDELNAKYPGLLSLLDKEALAHNGITRALSLQIAEKQKMAQVELINAEYRKAMVEFEKNRKWLPKTGWVSEVVEETKIIDKQVAGLREVIKQYKNAVEVSKNIAPSEGDARTWKDLSKEIKTLEDLIKMRKFEGKSVDDLLPKYTDLKKRQNEVNNAVKATSGVSKSAWDLHNAEISKLEDLIKIRTLNGQSVEDLVPKYVELKNKQNEVNESLQNMLGDTSSNAWKTLENNLKKAEDRYKFMLVNSRQFTSAELNQQKELMKGMKIKVQYNKAVEEASDLMGMTSRTANRLTDDLVNNLFTALGEGETAWDRFKEVGTSAMKALATEWVRTQVTMMSLGFQAGSETDRLGNSNTNFFSRMMSGLVGMTQGYKKMPLGGTKDDPTNFSDIYSDKNSIESISETIQAINKLKEANSGLATVTSGTLSPALNTAVSSIGAVSSPASSAAKSIGTIATNAPIAALSTGVLAGSMAVLAPAAVLAAPAFGLMATGLAAIAGPAATAATAMAAFAVAASAASVAWIPIAGAVLAPAAALATGNAISGATALVGASIGASAVVAGAGQLAGGAMSGLGKTLSSGLDPKNIVMHAKGGVVSSPTAFPMQGGNIGVAGEAGTEVIAPARRMSNGDLGVGAVAPNVTINNYANAAVEVVRRPDNETEIKIMELNAMLSSSRTNTGMTAAQQRMTNRGRQVG